MTYDAENRITGAGTSTYVYSPAGRRVKRTVNGVSTLYMNDGPGGPALSEFTTSGQGVGAWVKDYIYLNGELLATESATQGTRYHFSDHLGTPRVIADSAGTVISRHDYYPFGAEQTASSDGETHKFTGKERDSESGLDDMGFRYYSSSMGRFVQADPLFIEMRRLLNPQVLNLYTYSINNPLKYTDPSGLDVTLTCQNKDDCKGTVSDLNNRQDAQFQMSQDKNGTLQIVDQNKVDPSKLSTGERALYDAITDKDHHATLDIVSKDADVHFDRFDGNGKNTLDRSDLSQLGKVSGKLAGEVVAHDALEAYGSTFGNSTNYDIWHGYANQFFGKVTVDVSQARWNFGNPTTYKLDWTFGRQNTTVTTTTVSTPIPTKSVFPPGHIINVQEVKK